MWIEQQLDMCAKYKPLTWVGETGPIKSAVEPWLKRRMRERNTLVPLRWVSHSTANYKVAGARSFQALWEQGRVYLPKNKSWADELLRQLTRFPLGTLDDKVDCCSIFARHIAKVWEQNPPKEEPQGPVVEGKPELQIEKLWKPPQSESVW